MFARNKLLQLLTHPRETTRNPPECSHSTKTEHTPKVGDGRCFDEEVPEAVLSEAGRVHRLQLFVGGFNEDTRSRSFL